MVDKLVAHCAQIGYVAANMGGAEAPANTVEQVARANAKLVAAAEMSAASSAFLCSRKC